MIRPPLGDGVLGACVERCVLEFFLFLGGSLCESHAAVVWSDELNCGVSVCPSLSLPPPSAAPLCFGARAPGQTCDTNRHQTRHCTQAGADVGRDVLFQCNACCFLSAGGFAPRASVNQPLCVPACSESGRCERDGDACSASP